MLSQPRDSARGIDRRGRAYLAGATVATVITGFVVPVLSYVVLAGAAAGAWLTRQQPVVRWVLTIAAVALAGALVLALATTSPGHGSRGGSITRR